MIDETSKKMLIEEIVKINREAMKDFSPLEKILYQLSMQVVVEDTQDLPNHIRIKMLETILQSSRLIEGINK